MTESRGEVDLSADILEYYADNAEAFLAPEKLKVSGGEAVVESAPLGVLFCIEPWNFPYYQLARVAGPNLMLGNTLIVKHAPNVPKCAAAFETTMELGGSDAYIVLDDADMDKAIEWAIFGRMNNAGQCCVGAKRFILQEKIADEFLSRFKSELAKFVPGDPTDDKTTLAPLCTDGALKLVERQIDNAIKGGATVLLGGALAQKDVRFICVTDGGRILGLGDLGANGMGIPIGKLQLYSACAGVPPQYLLPMYLDAGTNNEQYLHDPLYLGMRKTRPSTEELYSFVDEFVDAVQEVFPKCCIHFEDWTGTDAVHLLQRYRDKYCVYNDDVQGTAGITLAGMINAAKLKGTKLKDEKYLFLGAGSAGIGLANLLCSALVAQGLTLKEAQSRVYMFDINGLLESTRKDLVDFQKPYAHQHAPTRDFVAAIESIKPTTIIGVSTIGGAFTQKVIESMSRINDRPVILALSNPTEHAECTPKQAYTWSKGKAIYAAGVQFRPGPPQRTDISTGTSEQLLHIPSGRYGDLCHAGEACHGRDVHRGRAGGGGSGAIRVAEPRPPLPAAVEHS